MRITPLATEYLSPHEDEPEAAYFGKKDKSKQWYLRSFCVAVTQRVGCRDFSGSRLRLRLGSRCDDAGLTPSLSLPS